MAKNKKGNKKSKQAQQQQSALETQAPPASESEPVQVHEGLTHTNTDKTCLDTSKPLPIHWWYRYNLWTGLYMLNPNERVGFNVFGFFLSACALLYLYVFITGFRDGFSAPIE